MLCPVLSSGSRDRGRKKRSWSPPLQPDITVARVVTLKTFLVLSVLYLKAPLGISLLTNSNTQPQASWAGPALFFQPLWTFRLPTRQAFCGSGLLLVSSHWPGLLYLSLFILCLNPCLSFKRQIKSHLFREGFPDSSGRVCHSAL